MGLTEMTDEISDHTTVRVLLHVAGINPTDAEIKDLARGFARTRATVASLYALPGVRDEEPAVTFVAQLHGARW
jgi:hypothetical protein